MNTQLAFIYNNERYATIFGADEFLKNITKYENAVSVNNVLRSQAYLNAYRSLSGNNVRDIPIIDAESITVRDNTFYVEGTINNNNVVTAVTIDAVGCHFGEEPSEDQESTELGETNAIEEDMSDEPVEDDGTVSDKDIGETEEISSDETEEDDETTSDKDNEENVQEETSEYEDLKEDTPEPVIPIEISVLEDTNDEKPVELVDVQEIEKEFEDLSKEEEVKEAVSNIQKSVVDQAPDASFRFNPYAKLAGKPVPNKGGFAMVTDVKPEDDNKFIIGMTSNKGGFLFDGSVYPPNAVRLENSRRKSMTAVKPKPQPQPQVQKAAPTKEDSKKTEDEEKQLKSFYKGFNTIDQYIRNKDSKRAEVSKLSSSDDAIKVTVSKQEAEKKPVRKEDEEPVKSDAKDYVTGLPKDLSETLSQIPTELLGGIEAFTQKPIDVTQLEKKGRMYCVENHWCRSGSWYCIDMVTELKRYFYNNDTGKAMAISVNTCKEWFKSTSKEDAK